MDINTPLVQEIRFWSTKKTNLKIRYFPQSVADFHKSKTKKILSIPKCWVGRFRSKLVKSNACLRFNRQRY